MKFILEIEFGTARIRTFADLGRALRLLANCGLFYQMLKPEDAPRHGQITDSNGEWVGRWQIDGNEPHPRKEQQ
ncbi:MAG TPA: hypothetical protein VFW94_23605 [Candidatus Acidoferrales bacterium]|nr:hypothetical protein [Candidatus Acidoferrales bacterium]